MIDEKKLIAEIREYIDEYKELDMQGVRNLKWCAMMEALELVESQPKVGEWIPCSERLPEEEEPVLVQWEKYDRHLNITITYLDVMWLDDAEEEVFETINGVPNGKVVAWMPLPEPYSERIGGE